MLGSVIVYSGLIVACVGMMCVVKPLRKLRLPTRRHGLVLTAVGVLLAVTGALLPVTEMHVTRATTHLDQFAPRWHFSELHTIRIAAPPERVFKAIKGVRADEILLFRTLTWLRRGGRPLPESILNAGERRPLLDVATSSGFIWLADDHPREVVVGAVVLAPKGARGKLTPAVFQRGLPPGFALAAMNFLVVSDGRGGSVVSTETRVFASSDASRRRFATYWRVIYPGSAIIRRMWLRAIRTRALHHGGLP